MSSRWTSSSPAIRSGRADLTKLLLQRGSGVNRGGGRGRGPLHEAARLGKTELVSLLLEAGALTDPRSRDGLTPLALAAQAGRCEVVETLLRRGVRAGGLRCVTYLLTLT